MANRPNGRRDTAQDRGRIDSRIRSAVRNVRQHRDGARRPIPRIRRPSAFGPRLRLTRCSARNRWARQSLENCWSVSQQRIDNLRAFLFGFIDGRRSAQLHRQQTRPLDLADVACRPRFLDRPRRPSLKIRRSYAAALIVRRQAPLLLARPRIDIAAVMADATHTPCQIVGVTARRIRGCSVDNALGDARPLGKWDAPGLQIG
jgi:hypothetical protein